jgi:hypothetical protein
MLNVFYNPVEAIEDAKGMASWKITLAVVAISAVLFGISGLIAARMLSILVLLGIIAVFAVSLFVGAFFVMLALWILGAENAGYLETLTALAYSFAPLSAAAVAGLVLGFIPYAGTALSLAVLMAGSVMMVAIQLRALKELTETDLLTVLVASWFVMTIGSVIPSIFIASSTLMGLLSALSSAA